VWERADELDPVFGEELGQFPVRPSFQDRQVAAVDDAPAERCALLNQPTEAGVELRSPAGDVDARDRVSAKRLDAIPGGLP